MTKINQNYLLPGYLYYHASSLHEEMKLMKMMRMLSEVLTLTSLRLCYLRDASLCFVSIFRCGWRRRVRVGSWRVQLCFACRRSTLGPGRTTSAQTAMRSRKSGSQPWARLQSSTCSQQRGAVPVHAPCHTGHTVHTHRRSCSPESIWLSLPHISIQGNIVQDSIHYLCLKVTMHRIWFIHFYFSTIWWCNQQRHCNWQ